MITVPGVSSNFVEGFVSSLAASVVWFGLYSTLQRLWKIERLSQFVTFEVPPLLKYLIIVCWSTAIGYVLYAFGYLSAGSVFFALGISIYPVLWLYNATNTSLSNH